MAQPLYFNFNKLPYWNQEDQNSAVITGGAQVQLQNSSEQAPKSQDFNSGYDSTVGRLNLARRQQILQKANANFCDGQSKFPLFLTSLTIDFALSGNTAQSQLTRDFYPHNIVMPTFQVMGICYDQTSYGELCEFIHFQQRNSIKGKRVSVTYEGQNHALPLMQLYVHRKVPSVAHIKGTRTGKRGVTWNNQLAASQTIKGQHEEILCLGYISSAPRQHQTGVYAPTYTLDFVVAYMLRGPYNDRIVTNVHQDTWVSMVKGSGAKKWGTKSELASNKKDLTWAAAHTSVAATSRTVTPPGDGGSASSASGGSVDGGSSTSRSSSSVPADGGSSSTTPVTTPAADTTGTIKFTDIGGPGASTALPSNATVGVYYVDGTTENQAEVRARLPNATLLGITPLGNHGEGCNIVDIESTNPITADTAPQWVSDQLALNMGVVGVYATASTWDSGLLQNLMKFGTQIKRWVADWDGNAQVPTGYDAKQYSNNGVGADGTSRVDLDIANNSFFE